MNPGRLDKYVSLRRLDTTIDAIGGTVSSWTHVAFAWAEMLPQNGREFIAAQTRIAAAAGVLRIRWRADVAATWRVSVEGVVYEVAAPPVQVGRLSFLDLILTSVPASESMWPMVNVFEVSLKAGDVLKAVTFPAAFQTAPRGLYVQLLVPTGAGSFNVLINPANITAAGFVAEFGAAVPSAGYKLSVQAFQFEQTFTIDLAEGAASQAVEFAAAFPSVPRGLKATLLPPSDGYEFTAALVVKSLTAAGFSLEFGAVVPGPGYRALIQVSL